MRARVSQTVPSCMPGRRSWLPDFRIRGGVVGARVPATPLVIYLARRYTTAAGSQPQTVHVCALPHRFLQRGSRCPDVQSGLSAAANVPEVWRSSLAPSGAAPTRTRADPGIMVISAGERRRGSPSNREGTTRGVAPAAAALHVQHAEFHRRGARATTRRGRHDRRLSSFRAATEDSHHHR